MSIACKCHRICYYNCSVANIKNTQRNFKTLASTKATSQLWWYSHSFRHHVDQILLQKASYLYVSMPSVIAFKYLWRWLTMVRTTLFSLSFKPNYPNGRKFEAVLLHAVAPSFHIRDLYAICYLSRCDNSFLLSISYHTEPYSANKHHCPCYILWFLRIGIKILALSSS